MQNNPQRNPSCRRIRTTHCRACHYIWNSYVFCDSIIIPKKNTFNVTPTLSRSAASCVNWRVRLPSLEEDVNGSRRKGQYRSARFVRQRVDRHGSIRTRSPRVYGQWTFVVVTTMCRGTPNFLPLFPFCSEGIFAYQRVILMLFYSWDLARSQDGITLFHFSAKKKTLCAFVIHFLRM